MHLVVEIVEHPRDTPRGEIGLVARGVRAHRGLDGEGVLAQATRLGELGEQLPRRLAGDHGNPAISGSASGLAQAPLVDGLLGEEPLALVLQRGDEPIGRHAGHRLLVHREIPGGFLHVHRVLWQHRRVTSCRVAQCPRASAVVPAAFFSRAASPCVPPAFFSPSISSSSTWMRSTICSSVRASGSGRSAWLRSIPPVTRSPLRNVMRPGTPTTTQFSGTARTTPEPAPIRLPAPTVKPPMILAPAPITTLSAIVGWRFSRLTLVPPRVTPCRMLTFSPTSAVSPMTTPMPWSMNSPGPSTAAGWISIPVKNRLTCDTQRAE